MKQSKPFQAIITPADKANARELSSINKCDYGFFFSTSGKLILERENKTRQYVYVWATNPKICQS